MKKSYQILKAEIIDLKEEVVRTSGGEDVGSWPSEWE